MSDQFTPTLDEARAIYALGTPAHHVSIGGAYAEFDRAIAKIRADAKVEALESVRTLIQDLTTNDDDPCQFDHHGGCQAHGYLTLEPGELCPQEVAKRWLKA